VALHPQRPAAWPSTCAAGLATVRAQIEPAQTEARAAAEALTRALGAVSSADLGAYGEGLRDWVPTELARAWIDLGRAVPTSATVRAPASASPLVAAQSHDLLPIALQPAAQWAGGTLGASALTVGWSLPEGATLACVSRDRGASWACRRSTAGDAGTTPEPGTAGDAGPVVDAGRAVDAGVPAVALADDAVGLPEAGRVRLRVGGRWLTVARVATGGLRARQEPVQGDAGAGAWHGVVDDGPGGVRGVETLWTVAAEGRVTLFVVGETVTVWWSDDQGDSWRAAAEAYEPAARISLDVGRVRPRGRR